MGLKYTPDLIAMVEGAQQHGLDVTTECYPYTAGSTELESAIFDPGWQEAVAITYNDLQWAETGERLTAETFAKYRKQGGIVVIHSIPEEAARTAVSKSDRDDRERRDEDYGARRCIRAGRGRFRECSDTTCAKRKLWT